MPIAPRVIRSLAATAPSLPRAAAETIVGAAMTTPAAAAAALKNRLRPMRLARSDILDLLNLAANCPLPKDSVAFEAARFAELDVPAVHETPLPAAPPGKKTNDYR
jgi:hypothetical protein